MKKNINVDSKFEYNHDFPNYINANMSYCDGLNDRYVACIIVEELDSLNKVKLFHELTDQVLQGLIKLEAGSVELQRIIDGIIDIIFYVDPMNRIVLEYYTEEDILISSQYINSNSSLYVTLLNLKDYIDNSLALFNNSNY